MAGCHRPDPNRIRASGIRSSSLGSQALWEGPCCWSCPSCPVPYLLRSNRFFVIPCYGRCRSRYSWSSALLESRRRSRGGCGSIWPEWARPIIPRSSVAAAYAHTAHAARAVTAPLRVRLSGFDGVSAWVLAGPATVVTAAAATLLLLTWIPHYLTWPWWPDVDQFAVSAQSWSAGIVPYRDLVDFDFPGPIYMHFLLGALFGWGATVAFYAIDAAFVVILGVALVAWSRRLFGSALPGLVSFLTFLGMYLGLDFTLVAQRDWHAPLLVVLGLFALEGLPGRRGRLIAALGIGVAFAFRPHEIVFLPALAAAIDEGARRAGEPWTRTIRPWLEWSGLAGSRRHCLAFSPLILAGVLDDLVRGVTGARQGKYNVFTWYSFREGAARSISTIRGRCSSSRPWPCCRPPDPSRFDARREPGPWPCSGSFFTSR